MPDAQTPRTTATIGDETRSGVACTTCESSYYTCTRRILTGRSACCPTCANTDTHDVQSAHEEPRAREVRQRTIATVHRTFDGGANPTTICGQHLMHLTTEPRRWRGGGGRDVTECAECFADPAVEVVEEPEQPTTWEVRENANPVVHMTLDPHEAQPTTVCGRTLAYKVRDPRQWSGHPVRTITECRTCFANVLMPEGPTPEEWTPTPGEFVSVSRTGQQDSAIRGWTATTVYVYVGPTRDDEANVFSTLVVQDGWEWAGHRTPLPEIAQQVHLTDVSGIRFWNVRTDHLVPSLGFGLNEAQTTARNRLLGSIPNLGTEPEPEPATREVRQNARSIVHKTTDTTERRSDIDTLCGESIYRTAREARVWLGGSPPDITECPTCFATTTTTTTERESITVPTTRFNVGDNLHPLSYEKMVDLPFGSVLTVRSRPRGSLNGGVLQFGCQSWPLDRLQQAQAIVEFTPQGVVVTADITHTDREEMNCAGNRIDLGEFNGYAASAIVKTLAEVVVDNALVMEHGFYGCSVHRGEILILGNGIDGPGQERVPLLSRLQQHRDGNAFGGTIGVTEGLRHRSMRECRPVGPVTSAHTMRYASERRWSVVPASPEQLAAADGGFAKAHTDSARVTLSNRDGSPLVVAAEPSPF